MPNIKIYIACHKDCEALQSDILKPIQVGAALASRRIEDFIGDDAGENISAKNARYCELTAQYWAWKHSEADYVGFMHYRRYFSFAERTLTSDAYNNVFYPTVRGAHERDLCLNDEAIRGKLEGYDLMLPYPLDLSKEGHAANTVYKHYATSPGHHIEDFDFCCDYIRGHYPAYVPAMEEYCASSHAYFLNMYVMRRELFDRYCEWLFPILDAFDAQRNYENDSVTELRTPGFLAERLFGVWFTHLKKSERGIRVCHAQTSFIHNTEREEIQPAFGPNAVAVCLGADDKYVPFAELVISSIVQNASPDRNYDIVVFSNGIAPLKQDAVLRAFAALPNVRVRFVEGAAFLGGDLAERDHINRSTYLRFIIPRAMRRYAKVIYLDCDLVVNRDLAELYDTDLQGNILGAVRDTIDACWYKERHDGTDINILERLGLFDPYGYFNAGVLVFDLKKFGALFSTEDLFALARTRRWIWQDQDMLNYLARNRVYYLDQRWNVLAHAHASLAQTEEARAPQWLYAQYLAARKDPYIVHYCGRTLPCFRPYADLREYFWKYARGCNAYESLLALQSEELAGRAGKRRSMLTRVKGLVKKGLRSLKQDGFSVTYARVRRKVKAISQKETAYGSQSGGMNAEDTELMKRAARTLFVKFESACQKAGAEYFLLGGSLWSAEREDQLFHGDDSRIVCGMTRADFKKLQGAGCGEKAEVFADKSRQGVRYGVRFCEFPAISVDVYVFDEAACPSSFDAWILRNEVRCQYVEQGCRHTNPADLFVSQCKGEGASLVLGVENPQSCYVQVFARADVFPIRKVRLGGVSVRVPANSQKVLRTLYLGWEKIFAFPPRTMLPDELKSLKQFLKKQ